MEEEHYRTVVVEVEGRRLKVGVPASIFSTSDGAVRRAKAPKRKMPHGSFGSGDSGTITSPMQATVVKVAVKDGDFVVAGDLLLVLEAMKMEQPVIAKSDGVVAGIHVMVGDSVAAGTVLANFE